MPYKKKNKPWNNPVQAVEIKSLFSSSFWHRLGKPLSYSNVLAHLSFNDHLVVIVPISVGMLLTHLQDALQNRWNG